MSALRRTFVCAGLVALSVAASPAAPSGATGDFAATASADGIRVGMGVRRFLVVEQFADAGAPTAHAHVDSLGNSVAWAAYPFPGDLVISVPGTVAGFGPKGLPALPEYPFYASATYPTKSRADVGTDAFGLQARAEEQAADASARAGLADDEVTIGLSRSAARAGRAADGTVQAVGESVVEGFAVGDVLRIGRLYSRAVAGARPGEPVSRTGATTVAEMTVVGRAVAIGPEGLTTPGGASPLPDTAPVRKALADAGLTIRYLGPLETSGGVVSAGVEVQLVREVAGVGQAVVSYVLGRAAASADAAPDPQAGPAGDPPVIAPGPLPPARAASVAEEPPAEQPSARFVTGGRAPLPALPGAAAAPVPFGPLPAGDAVAALPTGAGSAPAPQTEPAAGAAVVPGTPAGAVLPAPDFSGFLPILAAGGAVVAGAVIAAGRLMRRASWTS